MSAQAARWPLRSLRMSALKRPQHWPCAGEICLPDDDGHQETNAGVQIRREWDRAFTLRNHSHRRVEKAALIGRIRATLLQAATVNSAWAFSAERGRCAPP